MPNITHSTQTLIDSLKQACQQAGLGNAAGEYEVIIQMFLYKYFNDKFAHEAKRAAQYGARLSQAPKWDEEYATFTDDEVEDLFTYLPAGTPCLKPIHTVANLYNYQQEGDFADRLDNTMVDIGLLNADLFSMSNVDKSRSPLFSPITTYISARTQRDNFARALMKHIADPECNFEPMFAEKYDFFSSIFEYLIKDYNNDSGGVYAEYYTPRSIALMMARILVGNEKELRNKTCYDPAAGSGTLLMALAHTIGEERCSIYSQDISDKSSKMLRLNLILNNLVHSIPNIVQGNTLTNPAHQEADGSQKQFDFIVSNPPFNLDFSTDRDTLAQQTHRFPCGVPNIPAKDKKSMAIYTCFLQHLLYSLKPDKGKGAIVVPTGFITRKSGVEKAILQRLVDERLVYGCVIMPSQIFAQTGTNVSVLFFDRSNRRDKVMLIDASKLGYDGKDEKGKKRHFVAQEDLDRIVSTFLSDTEEEGFSIRVSYEDIRSKGYSLSAGQYFDVKIEYIDITPEQFHQRMSDYQQTLERLFEEGRELEESITKELQKIVLT